MRSFWPTVTAGAAGSGFAAVAATKNWWTGERPQLPEQLLTRFDSPVTNALALVALAAWGVVLVTRGRFRRAIAGLAALAAAGALVTVATGLRLTHDAAREEDGILGSASITAWPIIAAGCLLLALLASVAAVRLAPTWPEMSRKYDAPAAVPAAGISENLDVWKALDQGLDPTDASPEKPSE
ncbi:Trp biosynthesis-associated membrane protein [Nocardioides sp.]|uniref:Trp biosynthesis-associated membrane protein n=1 Tax=Nocardioides sp. TaxID=35761 RepID=UPI0039E6B8BE